MSDDPLPRPPGPVAPRPQPRLATWQLFVIAVAIWSTTWHAIVYQLQHTTPEFGVALRFGLAGALVLLACLWRGEALRFGRAAHLGFAFQGTFMYSVSYLCVYHAEKHVPSALVALGYSASPVVLGLGGLLLWRTPLTRRFVLGGLLGMLGVVLIFLPEFARLAGDSRTALGAGFTAGAVLLSAAGSLAASRNRPRGLPFWPALGFGMLYSAAVSFAFVLALGQPLALPAAPSWWLSLAWLAVFGSVVAFAAYLALQQRVGPGPAGTVGVATPVLALLVSTAFEGYRPSLLALAGVALAVLGNALALGLGPGSLKRGPGTNAGVTPAVAPARE